MTSRAIQRRLEEDSEVPPRILRLGDVALLLNVHPNTVRAWANKGLLRAYRIGQRRDRRFPIHQVMEFLSASEAAPPDQQ